MPFFATPHILSHRVATTPTLSRKHNTAPSPPWLIPWNIRWGGCVSQGIELFHWRWPLRDLLCVCVFKYNCMCLCFILRTMNNDEKDVTPPTWLEGTGSSLCRFVLSMNVNWVNCLLMCDVCCSVGLCSGLFFTTRVESFLPIDTSIHYRWCVLFFGLPSHLGLSTTGLWVFFTDTLTCEPCCFPFF